MDGCNFLMKLDFINNFLENASDEQIDELFNRAVELVNGKNKPVAIPFQPANPIPYFPNPIVIPIEYKNPNPYDYTITCSDMCPECNSNDDGDWLNLYRR